MFPTTRKLQSFNFRPSSKMILSEILNPLFDSVLSFFFKFYVLCVKDIFEYYTFTFILYNCFPYIKLLILEFLVPLIFEQCSALNSFLDVKLLFRGDTFRFHVDLKSP